MDELKKRRHQLSDPEAAIRELKARQNLTQEEQQQLNQLEAFEADLHSALDIQVPEYLAEEILLRSTMETSKSRFFSVKRFMAMAASIGLISFVSLKLLLTPSTALADDALKHVYHDIQNLSEDLPNAKEKMQRAMNAVGFTHKVKLQHISYAANCMVGKRTAVHLVVKINSETYTILLLPNVVIDKPELFSDQNLHGEIVAMDDGALIVIAMKDTQLDSAMDTLLLKFKSSKTS